MPIASVPYVILLGIFYGTTLIASRFSVGQYHPTNYVALRVVIASLAHMVLYTFSRHAWPRNRQLWGHATLLGVLGTAIPMVAFVSSLQYQSSGVTAVLITVGPAITVLLAHFLLPDETVDRQKSLGVGLALSGAVLMAVLGESGLPDIGRVNPLGYGLVLLGLLFGNGSIIYVRKYMREFNALDISSIRMFTASLMLVPLTAISVGFNMRQVTQQGYTALGYAALIGTFGGMLLSVHIVQRFGATSAAMTAYVIPVVAALGGMLVLGERITPGMLGGMALIGIGIAVINRGG